MNSSMSKLPISNHGKKLDLFLCVIVYFLSSCRAERTCSVTEEVDPALKPMVYDVGSGEETFLAYVTPDVSTFYRETPGSRGVVKPRFTGFAAKFINLSPEVVRMYWHPNEEGAEGILTNYIQPFEAVGTASYPTHTFSFTLAEEDKILKWFTMVPGYSIYYYDPLDPKSEDSSGYTGRRLGELTEEERGMYEVQLRNLLFAQQYKRFTGRDWLSRYPRPPPRHKMWRADYFGQRHWVETRETHFVTLPPESDLTPILQQGSDRRLSDDQPRLLQEYRTPQKTLNLTLTTLSCAPRAFSIQNFLSKPEVDHILSLSTSLPLHRSKTGDGDQEEDSQSSTRTSTNTWVERETSPVIDAIYRRAADVLRIDEAFLRKRGEDEIPGYPTNTAAETLQFVHYLVGQEYTPHHDFGYGDLGEEYNKARFATLLLYLNEGMGGGETSFPRWVNAESGGGLKVVPEVGKAVLFYSFLPDGNLDDLSQHAALPVTKGEKWLMNLWVWDPYLDF